MASVASKFFEIYQPFLLVFFSVTVYFVAPNGNKLEAQANVGDNLLDVVIENDVDIDGFGM